MIIHLVRRTVRLFPLRCNTIYTSILTNYYIHFWDFCKLIKPELFFLVAYLRRWIFRNQLSFLWLPAFFYIEKFSVSSLQRSTKPLFYPKSQLGTIVAYIHKDSTKIFQYHSAILFTDFRNKAKMDKAAALLRITEIQREIDGSSSSCSLAYLATIGGDWCPQGLA